MKTMENTIKRAQLNNLVKLYVSTYVYVFILLSYSAECFYMYSELFNWGFLHGFLQSFGRQVLNF